jgi:sarcosine oxidase gamma subunit
VKSAAKKAATAGAAAPTAGAGATGTSLKPGSYFVSVLNGTTTPGLARGVANRLQNAGFSKIGNVTNAADQSHSATLIEYAPNRRREALDVAKAIDVKPDAVQALTPGTRAIAGSQALVVVTVGNDQNQSPQH